MGIVAAFLDACLGHAALHVSLSGLREDDLVGMSLPVKTATNSPKLKRRGFSTFRTQVATNGLAWYCDEITRVQ